MWAGAAAITATEARVAAGQDGRVADLRHEPADEVRVADLEHGAVGDAAGELERDRAVARDPHG